MKTRGYPLLLAVASIAAGCATGEAGTKPPKDPAAARAEMVKKLSPEEIMQAGDEAALRGEYERAVTMYNQAIEAKPSADLFYRIGWIYSRLAKKSLAAQAYAHALEFDANHAGSNEELGLLYLEAKQRDRAAAHLKRAVAVDPQRWRSHNALGVLADATHDYTGAIAHYQAALAVRPASAMLLSNIGYSHYLSGELDEAGKYYEQALVVQPGYKPAVANTALLHARRRNYDKALTIMTGVTGAAQANNDIGYVAYQNGDLEVAERLLNEAIRLSPSYYETAQDNLSLVRGALLAHPRPTGPDEPVAASQ